MCIIHHCNVFALVRHFVEKLTYKFSLMIKGEDVGVNGLITSLNWAAVTFDLIN